MSIVKNQYAGHACTIDTSNNSYAINSFSYSANNETITGIAVSNIIWNGDWIIKQGNTVVWQTAAATSGTADFTNIGLVLNSNTTANLSVTTTGSQTALAMRISKYAYNVVGV